MSAMSGCGHDVTRNLISGITNAHAHTCSGYFVHYAVFFFYSYFGQCSVLLVQQYKAKSCYIQTVSGARAKGSMNSF